MYGDEDAAEIEKSFLNAQYNIYVGENKDSFRGISSHFGKIGSRVKIDLYGDADKINTKNGIVFQLEIDGGTQFSNYTGEKIMKLYQDKGFECQLNS